ncbi:uncharacterized protein LOC134288424 [Aedes albopictus]|uniref:PHD-type domain-containing protein n=1 Tax=Aedes albopictus TaxID=7160 RepID=A0ABM1YGR2_AEDAL
MPAQDDARDCGACDEPNSADVGMVACDGCSVWYHYTCAKVSPGVQQRSWRCSKCLLELPPEATGAKKKVGKKQAANLTVLGVTSSEMAKSSNANQKKTSEKSKNSEKSKTLVVPDLAASGIATPKKHPGVPALDISSHGEMRSSKSSTSTARARAQLALQRLEDERLLEEQKLREERARLEEERIRLEKERQLKEQEHAIKAKELAMQEKYLRDKFELEEQIADDESSKSSVFSRKDRTKAWLKSQHGMSHRDDKSATQFSEWPNAANDLAEPDRFRPLANVTADRQQLETRFIPEAIPDHQIRANSAQVRNVPSEPVGNHFRGAARSNASLAPSLRGIERAAIELNPGSHGAGPNSDQVAARQIWPKKLPTFSGDPEEWPIFVHSFETANIACGFTDVENIIRLRECLRGPARDAVVTKLMFPQSVNAIMETLRRLYGRPELLVKNLLSKVRRAEAPKPERLESLINFGLTVQQLCDHLEAANLSGHLSNPTLLGELVEKLPASNKLEWARFKRGYAEPTLKHFGVFMEELVYDASEVTSPIQQKTTVARAERDKPKERGHVYAHEEVAEVQRRDEEKLPASNKLEWARFKRGYAEPTLKHFGVFMEELVYDASEVTSPIQQKTTVARAERDKPKERGHVYAHEEVAEVQRRDEERQPCPICGKTDHRVRNCERFQQLGLEARLKAVHHWKLCEVCLFDHGQWRCRSRIRCNVGNCRDRHHPLLHRTERGSIQRQLRASECNAHERSQRSVLFRIVPVILFNGNRRCETFAFLDEGSSLTLIEASLARQLGAVGVPEPLELRWTSSVKRNEESSKRVDFEISGKGLPRRYVLKNAHTVEELNLPNQSLAFNELSDRFPHLRNLPISAYSEAVPRILLGLENLSLFAPLDSCVGRPGEPIAVKSLLGWSIYGPDGSALSKTGFVNLHECNCDADRELNDLVRQQFILEDALIESTPPLESTEEKRAREILENTTKFVDGKYETALLWKADEIDLPDSLPMAMKRLRSFEAQLAKDPNLREGVNQQIVDYVQKGYVHKATEKELVEISRRQVWYLPLGLVTHPKKQKRRLVWDGKAQVDGVSLNSLLLKGPDLLVSLASMICKFREKRVAFGGDIREMFLQLRMRTADKYFQCFLFRSDSRHPAEVYIADVAMFGATCSPCVAQHVLRVNADKWADEFPLAAAAIKDKTYMDDYYDSANTPEEAAELAVQVRTIHARGGFEMRNWVSNSEEVLEKLGEPGATSPRLLQSTSEAKWERVLGMLWHPESDALTFSTELGEQLLQYVSGGKRPTKRIALRIIMSLFDPLGLLAPYLIHGRILIQDLWRSGVQWDEEMRDEEFEKWTHWVELLPGISELSIPRCYFGEADPLCHRTLQCHVFTDASEAGYGCAVYFRIKDDLERVQCSLVMTKSKVAPLKHLSIPRLELEAALLGARMLTTVLKNHTLQPREVYLWTDSSTVLAWIRSDHRRYKQFVAHRIGEILSLTQAECWRWVPSKHNVADCLTKWVRDSEPDSNGRWFQGPSYLYLAENM